MFRRLLNFLTGLSLLLCAAVAAQGLWSGILFNMQWGQGHWLAMIAFAALPLGWAFHAPERRRAARLRSGLCPQ
jgi:hypothetical protein